MAIIEQKLVLTKTACRSVIVLAPTCIQHSMAAKHCFSKQMVANITVMSQRPWPQHHDQEAWGLQ
jgi:hypothetical protein